MFDLFVHQNLPSGSYIIRGLQVGASFESAIEESEAVESYEEVGEVYVPRSGNMRVKQ